MAFRLVGFGKWPLRDMALWMVWLEWTGQGRRSTGQTSLGQRDYLDSMMQITKLRARDWGDLTFVPKAGAESGMFMIGDLNIDYSSSSINMLTTLC